MKTAITGGIGSGKSYVSGILREMGIEVYDCDSAAKRLMRTSVELQRSLSALIGKDIFRDGILQKEEISAFLLKDAHNRQRIEDIVHPAVAADFLASGAEWLESAILFESGFNRRIGFDHTICVVAPDETRAQRVAQRDGSDMEKAKQWISCQQPQGLIAERCDFTIINDGKSDLENQIKNILKTLTKKNY